MDLQQLINDLQDQVKIYRAENKLTDEQANDINLELDALRMPNEDDQKEGLQWVNFSCIFLKVGLNVFWEDRKDNPELDLFIEHKSNSRGRRQTEEIEPDVNKIEVREL